MDNECISINPDVPKDEAFLINKYNRFREDGDALLDQHMIFKKKSIALAEETARLERGNSRLAQQCKSYPNDSKVSVDCVDLKIDLENTKTLLSANVVKEVVEWDTCVAILEKDSSLKNTCDKFGCAVDIWKERIILQKNLIKAREERIILREDRIKLQKKILNLWKESIKIWGERRELLLHNWEDQLNHQSTKLKKELSALWNKTERAQKFYI